MYVRCIHCLSETWVDKARVEPGMALRCQTCGSQQRPRDWNALLRERYGSTVDFAKANRIDLPSANAVLLGLMSLEQAQNVPLEMRFPGVVVMRRTPKHRRQTVLTCIMLLLASMAIGAHGWGEWERQAAVGRRLQQDTAYRAGRIESSSASMAMVARPLARVERNALDHPVRISSPTPQAVLQAYCEIERRTPRCEPLEIVGQLPSVPGSRLGLFREIGEGSLSPPHAIAIRKSRETRLWTAGDGKRSVTAFVPSPNRIGSRVVALNDDLAPHGRPGS